MSDQQQQSVLDQKKWNDYVKNLSSNEVLDFYVKVGDKFRCKHDCSKSDSGKQKLYSASDIGNLRKHLKSSKHFRSEQLRNGLDPTNSIFNTINSAPSSSGNTPASTPTKQSTKISTPSSNNNNNPQNNLNSNTHSPLPLQINHSSAFSSKHHHHHRNNNNDQNNNETTKSSTSTTTTTNNSSNQINNTTPNSKNTNINIVRGKAEDSLVDFIIESGLHPSIVMNSSFSTFVSILNPHYRLPDPKEIKDIIRNRTEEKREKAMSMLKDTPTVSITIDTITNRVNDQFAVVTAHFITDNGSLVNCMLGTVPIPTLERDQDQDPTGQILEQKFLDLFTEWRILDKVIDVTPVSDSNENINLAIKLLSERGISSQNCFSNSIQLCVGDHVYLDIQQQQQHQQQEIQQPQPQQQQKEQEQEQQPDSATKQQQKENEIEKEKQPDTQNNDKNSGKGPIISVDSYSGTNKRTHDQMNGNSTTTTPTTTTTKTVKKKKDDEVIQTTSDPKTASIEIDDDSNPTTPQNIQSSATTPPIIDQPVIIFDREITLKSVIKHICQLATKIKYNSNLHANLPIAVESFNREFIKPSQNESRVMARSVLLCQKNNNKSSSWISIYQMVVRFLELYPAIERLDTNEEQLTLLDERELEVARDFVSVLALLEFCTIYSFSLTRPTIHQSYQLIIEIVDHLRMLIDNGKLNLENSFIKESFKNINPRCYNVDGLKTLEGKKLALDILNTIKAKRHLFGGELPKEGEVDTFDQNENYQNFYQLFLSSILDPTYTYNIPEELKLSEEFIKMKIHELKERLNGGEIKNEIHSNHNVINVAGGAADQQFSSDDEKEDNEMKVDSIPIDDNLINAEIHNYIHFRPTRRTSMLEWWKQNKTKFPNIYNVARSILCIPATPDSSEKILTNQSLRLPPEFSFKKTRLNHENYQNILFLNTNNMDSKKGIPMGFYRNHVLEFSLILF
eukprot:gene4342-5434_t